jgi:hypothetical protein
MTQAAGVARTCASSAREGPGERGEGGGVWV